MFDNLISAGALRPGIPIKVAADASSHGVGAVINHVLPDLTELPIAYASRSLRKTKHK